jgi:parallel beta-helix repeat protein
MLKDKLLTAWVLIALLSPAIPQADTIPGGDVSGTWYAANSPYYIAGNITIPAGDTLTIEPNVVVDFLNYSFLLVNGFLEAVGNDADSILFTGAFWQGISFENAPDSSHLTYCIVQDVEDWASPLYGGITCMNCNPVISHCRISNNKGSSELWGAGGIMLYHSNANISWCNISGNTIEDGTGGGIKIRDSHPTITGCNISGNDGYYRGGGIDMFENSSLTIFNCTITGNVCSLGDGVMGGGIASQGSDMTITECIISHNVGGGLGGGGIWISGGSAMITSCTIDSNRAPYQSPHEGPGGGIYADCDTLLVDHCTFVDNIVGDYSSVIGWAIHTEGNTSMILTNSILRGTGVYPSHTDRLIGLFGASASISYSDFYLYRNAFVGNLPPGLGELTQVNAYGDSCDVYYNIYLDPVFVDYTNADYHLQENSPCIDAGDPASPYDSDGTIADMGAHFFDQRMPNIEISDSLLDFDTVMVGEQGNLPLTIYNVGTIDTLVPYDISCGLAVFSTDFDPADSLILPGDSLQIIVTFSPSDTTTALDTLRITNNDYLCQVELIGTGKKSTWVSEEVSAELPKEYALRPAYPNPFNPVTTIGFDLPKASEVTLKIYNVLGQEIATLAFGRLSAGKYKYVWQANGLASGVYFYRIEAGEFVQTKKMVMMK